MLFDVEMMSDSDYSSYMSGSNDYVCATVTIEADSPEAAAELAARRYPDMVIHKEYVKPSKKTSPDDSQYQKYYGNKYGRWIDPHWENSIYVCTCSICGGKAMHREFRWHEKGIYPVCPNCGTWMKGTYEEDREQKDDTLLLGVRQLPPERARDDGTRDVQVQTGLLSCRANYAGRRPVRTKYTL